LKFFIIERILVSIVLKAIIAVVVKCLKTGRFTGGELKQAVKILSNILIRIHSSFILFLDQTPRRRKPRSIASFGDIAREVREREDRRFYLKPFTMDEAR
jgi:hypothetical protein